MPIYADKEEIDATTPHYRAMLQMAAVFAELERGMIRERVRAGLSGAKEQGVTLGRPTGNRRRPTNPPNISAIITPRRRNSPQRHSDRLLGRENGDRHGLTYRFR